MTECSVADGHGGVDVGGDPPAENETVKLFNVAVLMPVGSERTKHAVSSIYPPAIGARTVSGVSETSALPLPSRCQVVQTLSIQADTSWAEPARVEIDRSVDIIILDYRREFFRYLPDCRRPSLAVYTDTVTELIPEAEALLLAAQEIISERELLEPMACVRFRRLIMSNSLPATTRAQNTDHAAEQSTLAARALRALINHSSDRVFVKDLDHRFLYFSDAFAENLDRRPEDVVGLNDLDIGANPIDVLGSDELGWPGFWSQDDAVVREGKIGIEHNSDWRNLLDEDEVWRAVRVPLRNDAGEIDALLVCGSRVAENTREELDVPGRDDVLQRLLDEMKKTRKSQQRAKAAERAKDKLLAAASHDMRQPVHAMVLFLDVLERRLQHEDDLLLIHKLKHSTDSLANLFDRMLDLSKLEAGVVNPDLVDVRMADILAGLESEITEIAHDKGLEVTFPHDTDVALHTDPVLLDRILRNLLHNAVRYTLAGTVRLELDVEQTLAASDATANSEDASGRFFNLIISDTGPGIPLNEQEGIFDEFYQIERDNAPNTGGLGLGLAIVKRLSDLLQLELRLESRENHGTRFYLRVPAAARTVDTGLSLPENQAAGSVRAALNATVVLIDDEPEILVSTRMMLEACGCRVAVGATTAEALSVLVSRGWIPDVVLADYRLEGGVTGDQAIAAIREEFNSDVPGLIITGDTTATRIKDAMDSGFPLLHKPVNPDELYRQLQNLANVLDKNHREKSPISSIAALNSDADADH